jgi:putative acetyltransferase
MKRLRPLECRDHDALLQLYRLAVESCAEAFYSAGQRQAWAQQALPARTPAPPTPLQCSLQRGRGLVSCSADGRIAAFAIREPNDRVSLLYCHPDCQRQGHASALLQALEEDARREGLQQLRTEASLVSRPLFERLGWQRSWQEELLIHGERFRRFRLHKQLEPILTAWPKPSSSSFSRKSGS